MKSIVFMLAVVWMLGFGIDIAIAQSTTSCNQCVCVADGSCGTESGCSSGDQSGCSSKPFTAACGGNYTLRYALSCSGSTCAQCYACVFLNDGAGNTIGVGHSSCQSGDCEGNGDVVSLTAGVEYKLFVCFRTCFGGSCASCQECVARGYVFRNSFAGDCNTIPSCNP